MHQKSLTLKLLEDLTKNVFFLKKTKKTILILTLICPKLKR